MRNSCIKTGCDFAFVDCPNQVYYGDAHQYENVVIFKVSCARFVPAAEVDFILHDDHALVLNDIIATMKGLVEVKSSAVIKMWQQYEPQLIGQFYME